jgi:hypothetical protein
MFGKLKDTAAAIDAEFERGVDAFKVETGKLIGISIDDMMRIEQAGLEAAKTRYTEIVDEIQRLQGIASEMETIIDASVSKLNILRMPKAVPNEKTTVPPMVHTNIATDDNIPIDDPPLRATAEGQS